MYCVKKIVDDLFWIGGNDRRLALFENVYPIPEGVSYNSYLLMDEKSVLLDTVDQSVSTLFFENLEHVLSGRELDYLVINHMEPDHAATLSEVLRRYPSCTLVGNAKTLSMVSAFFPDATFPNMRTVKEGDMLETGRHALTFVMAPMVHWPEVMVTYDITDHILFSADAFGTFGALNGGLFADRASFEREYLSSARRYYTNIVGKYGTQVQALLKKASALTLNIVCPLHGPVWRGADILWFVEKHKRWSSWQPEEQGVLIAYGSVYGHTENAANLLASMLDDLGVRSISVYDVSSTDCSYLLAEAFRYSHLVFASSTYNMGIFTPMETLLLDLKDHDLKNRTVALIENGSWAPQSGKKMKELLDSMKNMRILEPMVSIRSALAPCQLQELKTLAEQIAKEIIQ